MKLYLSGKITGINPHEVEHKFHINEVYFRSRDYHVINPLKIAPFLGRQNWLCYMITDIWALLRCDAILLLKDWNLSRGARIEVMVATIMRKTILTRIDTSLILPEHRTNSLSIDHIWIDGTISLN